MKNYSEIKFIQKNERKKFSRFWLRFLSFSLWGSKIFITRRIYIKYDSIVIDAYVRKNSTRICFYQNAVKWIWIFFIDDWISKAKERSIQIYFQRKNLKMLGFKKICEIFWNKTLSSVKISSMSSFEKEKFRHLKTISSERKIIEIVT